MYGYAELPLHDGRVPPHLLYYMKRLGRAIATYIVETFGPDAIVKRLSDPLWFQAFNNVIGMDWDSSGSTTVVLYVMKSFANVDTFGEVGFAVLGGKGSDSREVRMEVRALAEYGLDPERLSYVSRLSAKIDGVALQDGYSLYIHSLIVSESGLWTVVQQGMNVERMIARRYHIHASRITSEGDPHSGVACNSISKVLNLVDEASYRARRTILDLLSSPKKVLTDLSYVCRLLRKERALTAWIRGRADDSGSPADLQSLARVNPLLYRPITDVARIERTLNSVANSVIASFDDLLLLRNVGPEFVRALALVADVIYGDTPSFRDPVTHAIDPFAYAFAHGGKDGIPFPVKLGVMRETIEFLEDAIANANIEGNIKRRALEKLYRYWQKLQTPPSGERNTVNGFAGRSPRPSASIA